MTIARQKITELPSLNIEQKILTDEFLKRFDQDNGGAFDIIGFEPLLYEGVIAASEFTVYNANKLYLCFDFLVGCSVVAAAPFGLVTFYDEGNAINLYSQNNSIAYQAVAAVIWYNRNNIHIQNLYFSRIVAAQYDYLKFIGYRITY